MSQARPVSAAALMALLLPLSLHAQTIAWDDMRDITPSNYVAHRATGPIVIDGVLDDGAWSGLAWSELFVDIRGESYPAPLHETRMKMTWDDTYLYVAAHLVEPHVWGTLTEKNSIIYRDNDFEIFIDPDGDRHDYYEFEINPLNTIMELTMDRPYADGGDYTLGTNVGGLISAVHVAGTHNAPHDVDAYWSVEVAIPWEGLRRYAASSVPPADGEQWRINFSRVQWQHEIDDNIYRKVPDTHEENWVWSPTGVVDMHRPERWGYVQFSAAPPATADFQDDGLADARDVLMEVYYRQRAFATAHERPTSSLAELGFANDDERLRGLNPNIRTDPPAFEVSISVQKADGSTVRGAIDHEGRLRIPHAPPTEQP